MKVDKTHTRTPGDVIVDQWAERAMILSWLEESEKIEKREDLESFLLTATDRLSQFVNADTVFVGIFPRKTISIGVGYDKSVLKSTFLLPDAEGTRAILSEFMKPEIKSTAFRLVWKSPDLRIQISFAKQRPRKRSPSEEFNTVQNQLVTAFGQFLALLLREKPISL